MRRLFLREMRIRTGSAVRPNLLVSATGVVLVGSDVNDFRTLSGMTRSARRGKKISVATNQKPSGAKLKKPSPIMSVPAKKPIVRLAYNRAEVEKRLAEIRKKPIQMTAVIPSLFGKPSTSYVLTNGGTEIVAKKGGRGKKKKRKNGGVSSSQRETAHEPVTLDSSAQHLGKKDTNDAAKDWPMNYREKGKFGSFPIHDAHGDESVP